MSSSIDIKRIVHNGEDIIELKDANDNVLWNPYVNGPTPISFYNTYDIGDNVLGDDTMTTEYYEESGSITIRSSNPPYRDEVYSLHGTTTTSKVHLTQNDIYSLGYANGLYFYAIGIFDFLSEDVDYIITGNEFFNLTDFNDNDLLSGQDSIYLQLHALFGLQMSPGNFTATDEKNSHSSENTWLASTKWVVVIGTSQEKASLPEDIYLSFTFKLYGDLIDPDMFKIMFMRYPRYVDKINAAQTYMIPEVEDVKVPKDLKNYRIYGNTVTVKEKNIITVNWEQGTIISNSGGLSNSTTRVRSKAIPVDPNTTYTVKATTPNDEVLYGWLLGYDVNNVKTIRYPLPVGEAIYPAWQYPITFTTSANTAYVRLVAKYANDSEINIQPVTELYVGNKDYYEVEHYCGDRTGNLFDGELVLGSFVATDGSFLYLETTCITEFINVKSNTEYSIHITGAEIRHIGYYGGTFSFSSPTIREDFTFVTPNDCNQIRIVFRKFDQSKIDLTIFPTNTIMLNLGSTALPYEPYGYRVPVTVSNGTDAQTIPIYLSEQIRKVGDEAEYIDFGEQKQYFADGTSIDITLPALPTLSGTNTLTVGTEVQPSNVYVKGKIKEVN